MQNFLHESLYQKSTRFCNFSNFYYKIDSLKHSIIYIYNTIKSYINLHRLVTWIHLILNQMLPSNFINFRWHSILGTYRHFQVSSQSISHWDAGAHSTTLTLCNMEKQKQENWTCQFELSKKHTQCNWKTHDNGVIAQVLPSLPWLTEPLFQCIPDRVDIEVLKIDSAFNMITKILLVWLISP